METIIQARARLGPSDLLTRKSHLAGAVTCKRDLAGDPLGEINLITKHAAKNGKWWK